MNDTEIVEWIANHLVSYNLGFNRVEMEYIDNKGYHHIIKMETTEGLSEAETFRGIVSTAIKAEKDESL